MITVLPIQDKGEQEKLCRLCGVTFHTEWLAYRAENEDGFAGICQFFMNSEGGHLFDLCSPHGRKAQDALFVMGRAALNFMDLCGAKRAFFDGDKKDDALLRRVGFIQDENGRYTIDLEGFFCHPCQHAAH